MVELKSIEQFPFPQGLTGLQRSTKFLNQFMKKFFKEKKRKERKGKERKGKEKKGKKRKRKERKEKKRKEKKRIPISQKVPKNPAGQTHTAVSLVFKQSPFVQVKLRQ